LRVFLTAGMLNCVKNAALLLRFLLLSMCFSTCALRAQSRSGLDTLTRPEILGTLEQGKYFNHVIGFEIQLDPNCTFADESRAIAWSTQFPERLDLAIRCGDVVVLLNSFPLHGDEEADLRRDAQVSLQGVMDGGGFKKRGSWQSLTKGATDVLVQELTRHRNSSKELGFYHALMIGRRYVSILATGPEANRAQLSRVATTLRIKQNPM